MSNACRDQTCHILTKIVFTVGGKIAVRAISGGDYSWQEAEQKPLAIPLKYHCGLCYNMDHLVSMSVIPSPVREGSTFLDITIELKRVSRVSADTNLNRFQHNIVKHIGFKPNIFQLGLFFYPLT